MKIQRYLRNSVADLGCLSNTLGLLIHLLQKWWNMWHNGLLGYSVFVFFLMYFFWIIWPKQKISGVMSNVEFACGLSHGWGREKKCSAYSQRSEFLMFFILGAKDGCCIAEEILKLLFSAWWVAKRCVKCVSVAMSIKHSVIFLE